MFGRYYVEHWAAAAALWQQSIEASGWGKTWVDAAQTFCGANTVGQLLTGGFGAYKRYANRSGYLPSLTHINAAASSSTIVARGSQSRPLTLPLRISDARQGLVFFAVPLPVAQDFVDRSSEDFAAFPIARDKASLCLFLVDYRASDIGAFCEFGIAVFVTPRERPAALPGMLVLADVVNLVSGRDAGHAIWGLPSVFSPDMEIDYRADAAIVRLGNGGVVRSTMTFPRQRGVRVSNQIPFVRYSSIDGVAHATLFLRSGAGEHVAVGGQMGMALCLAPAACGCVNKNAGTDDGLCGMLGSLGLPGNPIGHIWTEHMSGLVGAPQPSVA